MWQTYTTVQAVMLKTQGKAGMGQSAIKRWTCMRCVRRAGKQRITPDYPQASPSLRGPLVMQRPSRQRLARRQHYPPLFPSIYHVCAAQHGDQQASLRGS